MVNTLQSHANLTREAHNFDVCPVLDLIEVAVGIDQSKRCCHTLMAILMALVDQFFATRFLNLVANHRMCFLSSAIAISCFSAMLLQVFASIFIFTAI